MKNARALVRGSWLFAAVPAFFAGLSATASADIRTTGSSCQPSFGAQAPNINYEGNAVSVTLAGAGNPISVTCPQSAGNDIGQPSWLVRVADNSTVAGFNGRVTCFGSVYNSNGDAVSVVSGQTGDVTTGIQNITYAVAAGAPTFPTAQYQSTCFLPLRQGAAALSAIRYLDLF